MSPAADPAQRPHFPWDIPLIGAGLLLAHWRPQEAFPEWQPFITALIGGALAIRLATLFPQPRLAAHATPIAAALLALPLWSWLATRLGVQPPAGTLVLGTLLQGALAALWAALWVMSAPAPELRLRWGVTVIGLLGLMLALQGFWDQAIVRPRQIALLEEQWQPGDRLSEALLHNLREGRMRSTLGDPNHLGLITAVGTLALVLAAMWTRQRAAQIALALGALVTCGALIATGSRGGWLSLMAGLVVMSGGLAATGQLGRRLLIGAVAVAALGAAAIAALALTSPPAWLQRVGNLTTVQERLGYWGIAWQVFLKSPLMGEGLGGFATWYPSLRPEGLGTARFTHNLPLQFLAEIGLIGLALALAPLALLIRRSPEGRLRGGLSVRLAMLALLAVVAVNSLVQHSILFRELWVDCLILLGLILGWWIGPGRIQPRASTWRWAPLVIASAIAAALILPAELRHARARLLNQRADEAIELGQPQDVLDLSDRCVETEPGYDLWHTRAAQRLMFLAGLAGGGSPQRSANLLSQAEEHLIQAARLNPLRPSTWSTQASLAARRGDPEDAIDLQREAIARHPAEPLHHREMAMLLFQAGRLDEALTEASLALQLKEDDIESWFARGEILLGMRRFDEARECAQAVIDLHDWHPGAWHLLSRIEHAAGNTAAAREAADEALERYPESGEIRGWRNRLGYD